MGSALEHLGFGLWASSFALIFLAELPDKTILAVLTLAARGRAIPVFFGVFAAFLVQTVIAVSFGSWLAALPKFWVKAGSGALFLGFALATWIKHDEHLLTSEAAMRPRVSPWRQTSNAFLAVFVAEWGDLTQLATAALAARYPNQRITVFTSALTALACATGLAVWVGQKALSRIPPRLLHKVSAVAFAAVGIWIVLSP